jgi:predicted ArsR family transcriptional regulator
MPEPRRVPSAPDVPSTPLRPALRAVVDHVDGAPGGPTLRRDLLLRLRHDGPSSPESLASSLGASRTGVLQQLHALEAAGLVSRQAVRHGVGRPRHLYDVTAAAQDLFPTNYEGLAAGLLAAIRAIGGESLIDDVFEERRRLTRERVGRRLAERLPTDAPILERARELAVIQDEAGYLAEAFVDEDGVVRLVERNCAIHHVAVDTAAACQAELDLFREVLGTDVQRESHIVAGDRCCSYRIGSPTD